MPRDYDRAWTATASGPVRRFMGYSTDDRVMTRFVVQLEYFHDGNRYEVVRFDHDPENPMGHDVTTEGVHMDVYRNEHKLKSVEVFPAMPAAEAFTYAENHLSDHAERYIKRYEKWHGIRDR